MLRYDILPDPPVAVSEDKKGSGWKGAYLVVIHKQRFHRRDAKYAENFLIKNNTISLCTSHLCG